MIVRTLAVMTALLTTGCGSELVRPSAEPPALEAREVEAPLEVGVECRVEGVATDAAPVTADTAAALISALKGARVFRGEVTPARPADAERPLGCEALLRVEHVQTPGRGGYDTFARVCLLLLPPIGVGLSFVWVEWEPELVDRYVLEVRTPGEAETRYEVTVRGTIDTQVFGGGDAQDPVPEARVPLRDLALRSLVSRFADDQAAHDRLRAQLDDGPAPELEPLLVAKETHVARARWRTRRLIGWKSESMAAFVAEAKSAELRRLVGKLEACMLDLSHEAEVQKDAAQAATAKGGDAAVARELSLAYRERVEALRPVLAAVKDELEGRGR